MRIQANYFSYSPVQKKNNNFRPLQSKVSTPVADTFSSKNVSFGVYPEYYHIPHAKKEFDPLNAPDKELQQMAMNLNDYTDEQLHWLIDLRYQKGFLTSDTEGKRRTAFDRLQPRLQDIRRDKKALMEKIEKLSLKELNGTSNVVSQKLNLKQKYLAPLERMVSGNQTISVANGILIHGKADNNTKNDFRQWLFNEAAQMGVSAVNVDFSSRNPEKSFEKLNAALENSKRYNKMTGLHTITFVDGIDSLLTDVKNDEALDYIDDFKTMVENASKNYHTTFVIQTNMPLDDFDSASIGNQRFNLKFNLNAGITDEEKKELERCKDRLSSYNKLVNHDAYIRYEKKTTWVGGDDEDYFTYSRSRYDM